LDGFKIKWAERLPHEKLRRLYESQASLALDEELLEDVAVTLYLRCRDIIAVERARHGEVRCPFCYAERMEEIYIKADGDELRCPGCARSFSRAGYVSQYRRAQLNMGGAGKAFTRFADEYERPAPPETRMLQIDRLIHEYHYSLKAKPGQPTRSVGPNLLNLKLTEAMKFLNELSGVTGDNAEMRETAEKWLDEKKKWNEMWNWDL